MLLLFDVEYPSVIYAFIESFEIASGDFEEITQYFPAIPESIVNEEDLRHEFYPFGDKLQEEFPYLLLEYKASFMVVVVNVLLILPILKLVTKICPK